MSRTEHSQVSTTAAPRSRAKPPPPQNYSAGVAALYSTAGVGALKSSSGPPPDSPPRERLPGPPVAVPLGGALPPPKTPPKRGLPEGGVAASDLRGPEGRIGETEIGRKAASYLDYVVRETSRHFRDVK